MSIAALAVSAYTPLDVQTWLQSENRQLFIGDVLDGSNSDTMGVGFARYAPGESNEWVVTYDEALVVTSGSFSVTSAGVSKSAQAGGVLFVRRGTELVYAAGDEGAELVYVMYPQPASTALGDEHPDLVATFQPTQTTPPRFADGRATENIARLRDIWGPIERGESDDYQPFFDALADDFVFEGPLMELHGKEALVGYFVSGAELMEFNPFERPLEYFGSGDRVVQLGFEIFRVKATGVTHRAEWAWVYDFEDGQIARIRWIQDLGDIAATEAEAGSRAQAFADRAVAGSDVA